MSSDGSRYVLRRSIARAAFLVAACVRSPQPNDSPIPDFLLGEFVDDYGNQHSITRTEWRQGRRSRFHITEWHVAEQFLVAQNDSANAAQRGRWTRIDWMPLPGMAPYTWGFCFSAYDAPTAAAAAATQVTQRATPRTGCNGYPFSRMRAREPGS